MNNAFYYYELISKLNKPLLALRNVSEDIGDEKNKSLAIREVDGLIQEAENLTSRAINILSTLEEDVSEI